MPANNHFPSRRYESWQDLVEDESIEDAETTIVEWVNRLWEWHEALLKIEQLAREQAWEGRKE